MGDIVLSPQVGQGFAQVMDTRAYAQDAIRNMQYYQQRKSQNQKAMAEMLTSVKSDGLRVEDMPIYNQTLKEWQSIYIQNPNLYSNPASNIKLYQQAQQLKQKLDMMPKISKQYGERILATGTHMAQNMNDYDDETVEKVHQASKLSTFEGMALFGDKMPDPLDFRKRPQAPDFDSIAKEADLLAARMPDGKRSILEYKTHKDDPGIPVGKIRSREIVEYHPDALITAATHKVNQWGRSYESEFKKATPLEVSKLQEQLDNTLGDKTFVIDTPEEYGTADIVLKLRQKDMGWKEGDDEVYKQQQKDIDRKQRLQDSMTMEGIRNANAIKRLKLGKALSAQEKKTLDMKIHTDVALLGKRMTEGADVPELTRLTASLQEMSLGLDEPIKAVYPKNPQTGHKLTKEQFRAAVNHLSAGREQMGGVALKDSDIDRLYDRNIPVLSLKWSDEIKDANGTPSTKPKAFLFDPTKVSSKGALISIIRKGGVGSNKHGFIENSVVDDYVEE